MKIINLIISKNTTKYILIMAASDKPQGSTFEFKDVEPTSFKPTIIQKDNIINCKSYVKDIDSIMMHTDIDNIIKRATPHGLLSTISYAYSYHIPIIFRPDDIWMSIISCFARYVNANEQEFREIFINHDGKKDLIIHVADSLANYSTPSLWSPLLQQMHDKIKTEVKSNVCSWIVPDFTTTTQIDKDVSIITLMSAFKNYFSYGFQFDCGLSKVTLQGTLEDWIKLKDKLTFISEFNMPVLTNWTKLLDHVLSQFIKAYQGDVDEKFWQRICTKESRGSGGQQKYKGWMLVFSPFNKSGTYILHDYDKVMKTNCYAIINDDEIVECTNETPVTINDNGTIYNTILYSGIIGSCYQNNTLTSNIGWIMIHKKPVTTENMLEHFKNRFDNSLHNRREGENERRLESLHKIINYCCEIAKDYKLTDKQLLTICQKTIYNTWFYGYEYNEKNVKETFEQLVKKY